MTQVEERLRPFYHGVASGDPLPDRVIIWTRVTPENGDTTVNVRFRVATDTAMQNIVRSGEFTTSSERDFTIKIDVDGLQAGTVYYYNFSAYNRYSIIGRMRTTRPSNVDHTRLAVVSCSNYPAGYFTAYRKIADRNDLDGVLHLGDYIYEYDADTTSYGGATGARLGRRHEPDAELVTLTDYRTRYSQYRLDPDLRRAHQQHPMIHVWDDHESANDSYTDGAENHQSEEGDWAIRKAISKRVCYEWMPTREQQNGNLYRLFSFGTLVDLFMLDTRLDGRDKQVQGVGEGASQASKDSLNNPDRKIMSSTQFDWLTSGLTSSTATWRLIGNQVLFSPVDVTPIDTTFLFNAVGPIFSAFIRPQIPTLQFVFESAFYGDVWNNYPAQRTSLLNTVRDQQIKNLVVVTGDFHSSFAFNVPTATIGSPTSSAVEFMTPSISAPNFDENLNSVPTIALIAPALLETIDTTLIGLNSHLKWHDITEHGYEIVDFTPQRVQCDWFFMDSILVRPSNETWARGYFTMAQESALQVATAPAPGKSIQDLPAPAEPPIGPVSVQEETVHVLTVLGYGPNPTRDALFISYVVEEASSVHFSVVDAQGAQVLTTSPLMEHGLRSVVLDLRPLAAGRYSVNIHTEKGVVHTGIVVAR
ncbi:MAG TPA: alkaline phosphatase D family protein [Candidatus Didemnitutus sp.]|nr:alkaline phosphatase D family protein [Candidatus Didemnitutus sp.]